MEFQINNSFLISFVSSMWDDKLHAWEIKLWKKDSVWDAFFYILCPMMICSMFNYKRNTIWMFSYETIQFSNETTELFLNLTAALVGWLNLS